MEKGYSGKISNKGSQIVKAVYQAVAGKKPVVKSGGDLRSKPSKK